MVFFLVTDPQNILLDNFKKLIFCMETNGSHFVYCPNMPTYKLMYKLQMGKRILYNKTVLYQEP